MHDFIKWALLVRLTLVLVGNVGTFATDQGSPWLGVNSRGANIINGLINLAFILAVVYYYDA